MAILSAARRSMLLCLPIALGLVGCGGAPGADPERVELEMMAAASLYSAGSFAEAADAYTWLEAQGYRHPDLYFNQGLAQAAAGDERLGLAILAHERALRLRPRDREVRSSLDRLRTRSGAMDSAPKGLDGLLEASRLWLSERELWLLAGLFWNLALFAYFLGRWRPEGELVTRGFTLRKPGMRASAVTALLILAMLCLRGWQDAATPEAIVIAMEPSLSAVPAPPDEAASEAIIPPGTKVKILDEREGYLRVRVVGDSLGGWLEAAAVALVSAP